MSGRNQSAVHRNAQTVAPNATKMPTLPGFFTRPNTPSQRATEYRPAASGKSCVAGRSLLTITTIKATSATAAATNSHGLAIRFWIGVVGTFGGASGRRGNLSIDMSVPTFTLVPVLQTRSQAIGAVR